MASRSNAFTIMTLALWCGWGTPSVFAQELIPTGPAAKSFMLGAFEISVLRDGGLAIPNDGSIFGLNAKSPDVATVLSNAGAPTDKIRLDINALLIRMPGRVVLVDTGYGPAGHGALRESLSSAGMSADDVTDILITHAHPDHVGGLVDAQDRSVFPKAAIRMSAREWDFMKREADTQAIVAAVRVQVKTFEPGRPVLPGITPLALPGHTPGHVAYEIVSQGHELVDIGDLAHSYIVSLAKPAWTITWDSDKQAGVETRRQQLQRLADARHLIFAPHFPFPGVGRIEQTGEGFRFRPELPANK